LFYGIILLTSLRMPDEVFFLLISDVQIVVKERQAISSVQNFVLIYPPNPVSVSQELLSLQVFRLSPMRATGLRFVCKALCGRADLYTRNTLHLVYLEGSWLECIRDTSYPDQSSSCFLSVPTGKC
jgi:hypothetical protein